MAGVGTFFPKKNYKRPFPQVHGLTLTLSPSQVSEHMGFVIPDPFSSHLLPRLPEATQRKGSGSPEPTQPLMADPSEGSDGPKGTTHPAASPEALVPRSPPPNLSPVRWRKTLLAPNGPSCQPFTPPIPISGSVSPSSILCNCSARASKGDSGPTHPASPEDPQVQKAPAATAKGRRGKLGGGEALPPTPSRVLSRLPSLQRKSVDRPPGLFAVCSALSPPPALASVGGFIKQQPKAKAKAGGGRSLRFPEIG